MEEISLKNWQALFINMFRVTLEIMSSNIIFVLISAPQGIPVSTNLSKLSCNLNFNRYFYDSYKEIDFGSFRKLLLWYFIFEIGLWCIRKVWIDSVIMLLKKPSFSYNWIHYVQMGSFSHVIVEISFITDQLDNFIIQWHLTVKFTRSQKSLSRC